MEIDFFSQIKLSASLLKNSEYAIAFTGAGISTASGIPDFRSPKKGLWEIVNPFEVASLTALETIQKNFLIGLNPYFYKQDPPSLTQPTYSLHAWKMKE